MAFIDSLLKSKSGIDDDSLVASLISSAVVILPICYLSQWLLYRLGIYYIYDNFYFELFLGSVTWWLYRRTTR